MIATGGQRIISTLYAGNIMRGIILNSYLRLPIPARNALKYVVFNTFRPMLANTNAYRKWHRNRFRNEISRNSQTVITTPAEFQPSNRTNYDPVLEYAEPYEILQSKLSALPINTKRDTNYIFPVLTHEAANKQLSRLYFSLCEYEPEVSIIIPCYNNFVLTVTCLSSLSETLPNDLSVEVILVDDSSTQTEYINISKIPGLIYIRNQSNIGYSKSCNFGASMAKGKYLIFLNNDAITFQGWLPPLLESLKAPGVGICGPKIVNPDGTLQEAGCQLTPSGTSVMVGYGGSPDDGEYTYRRFVDYVSGACLAISRTLFMSLNGFDEIYSPFYFEDPDLCLRAQIAGYVTEYQPASVICHRMSSSISESKKKLHIASNMVKFKDRWLEYLQNNGTPRVLAWYLPQFHPIPENDRWWGKGFTDWQNVARATPRFQGHYQPRVPADLGYYDLRLVESLRAQANLARKYRIDGFVYYYYWFRGKRLLETPINILLANDDIDMPFCVCWANENWTRRWDGREQEVLIAQEDGDEDRRAMILDIITYMRDKRYIRIMNKPILLIYRADVIKNFNDLIALFRSECAVNGVGDIYIIIVESMMLAKTPSDPRRFGADASVEFPPHEAADGSEITVDMRSAQYAGQVADYSTFALSYAVRRFPSYPRFKGVTPGWDNTPRRPRDGFALHDASPGAFAAWIEHAMVNTVRYLPMSQRFVFVNAWNEWAEGAYLEPDTKFQHSYLEAVLFASRKMQTY